MDAIIILDSIKIQLCFFTILKLLSLFIIVTKFKSLILSLLTHGNESSFRGKKKVLILSCNSLLDCAIATDETYYILRTCHPKK